MKSTIHKWVVNVTPVTNPTQYTKSDKQKVQTIKLRFSPKSILVRFRESLPICLLPIAYAHAILPIAYAHAHAMGWPDFKPIRMGGPAAPADRAGGPM